jgi:argininosuccinate synthase
MKMKAKQKIIARMALPGNGGLHYEKAPAGAMKLGTVYAGVNDANREFVQDEVRKVRARGFHVYVQDVIDENGMLTDAAVYYVDFAADKRELAA